MREAILMISTGVKGVGKSYATLWKEVIVFARGLHMDDKNDGGLELEVIYSDDSKSNSNTVSNNEITSITQNNDLQKPIDEIKPIDEGDTRIVS